MVIVASYEIRTFFASIILALILGIIYDLMQAFGRVTKKRAICDFAGWGIICILCGGLWLYAQNGELRWYMVTAAVLSGILYFLTVEKYVLRMFLYLASLICRFFDFILKILLTPLNFLCKILGVYIKRAKTKFFKKVEDKNDEKTACIQD